MDLYNEETQKWVRKRYPQTTSLKNLLFKEGQEPPPRPCPVWVGGSLRSIHYELFYRAPTLWDKTRGFLARGKRHFWKVAKEPFFMPSMCHWCGTPQKHLRVIMREGSAHIELAVCSVCLEKYQGHLTMVTGTYKGLLTEAPEEGGLELDFQGFA